MTKGKGPFDIPRLDYQSTTGARDAYFAIWGTSWPHDDQYLRLICNEMQVKRTKRYVIQSCDDLLTAMREDHEFTPSA